MNGTIAFVTYAKHPEITDDDSLAAEALANLNVEVKGIPWDEPGIEWPRFDAVVFRSCWDYFHHSARFMAWLDSLHSRAVNLVNDYETLRWNAEKTYLEDLKHAGIAVMPTVYAFKNSDTSISQVLRERNWNRAVVKPTISGTSWHTWVSGPVHAAALLRDDQAKLDVLLQRRSMMLQEYFPEIESDGELSLIYFEGQYSQPCESCRVSAIFACKTNSEARRARSTRMIERKLRPTQSSACRGVMRLMQGSTAWYETAHFY